MTALSAGVLIVDDSKMTLRIIRNLLRQIAITEVVEAHEGGEALEKLRSGTFSLVISDWNMAPVTGLQLLQEMRSDPRLGQLPFIMVTAESRVENVVVARRAGANGYIVKPFDAETLRSKIERVAGRG